MAIGVKMHATNDKVILTDCDGVLLDWEYSFSSWMDSKGYEPVDGYRDIYNVNERYMLCVSLYHFYDIGSQSSKVEAEES
jgi:hypothetical protein